MDGHGQFGHDVVAFCKKYLEQNLLNHPHFHSDLSFAVRDTVLRMDAALDAKKEVDINFSGTTLVLAALRGSQLVVANVGDSRALLVRQGSEEGGELHCEQVTTDHKPSLPEEYCRIVAAKGRVAIEPSGVGRIYLPSVNMPGLAMSRSLGDRAVHQIGVTAEPQMLQRELRDWLGDGSEGLLLLGTDGVFDMTDNSSLAAALWDCGQGGSSCRSQPNSDGLAAKGDGESSTVALNIDTDSEDGKETLTTKELATATASTATATTAVAKAAVGMARSLDTLLDDTFARWMANVGLSDDISLIAVRISRS
mmetsp:Transcript_3824/g.5243  ORF Transcript_3824/g.5243 Transcript_3824/m.5243 type:complete len:309 (-) Transcript_3824:237-1163(-)